MRKRSTRILALLLSVVMLISASCVTAFAKWDNPTIPLTDENGKYYFSYSKASSWLMDMIDDLLSTVNDGKPLVDEKIVGFTVYVDFTSYEKLCDSLSKTWDSLDGIAKADFTGLLTGDLKKLNTNDLEGYVKRNDQNRYDYECVYTLVKFLYTNRAVLRDLLNQNFKWGFLDDILAGVLEENAPGLFVAGDGLDVNGFLLPILYGLFEDLTGREADPNNGPKTATTYPENGKDVDGALQDLVTWLLNDELGLPIDAEDIDIFNTSAYDLVNNIIMALLNNLVVPLLKDVLMDAFDIDVTPEYPEGPESELNNETLIMVFGIIEGLMSGASTSPDYSNCRYPGEKIEELLTWFFTRGGMADFIIIDSNGIALTDGFKGLLDKLCRLAIPLVYGLGFDSLPEKLLYTADQLNIEEGQPGYIPNSACYAQLIELVLSKITRGYYINTNASSIAEVGSYALASLLARICPEYDYCDYLDAQYLEDGGSITTAEGRVITKQEAVTNLPFLADYSANGQVLDANGNWQNAARNYPLPMAAIDMGVSVGVFFLDGLITADFDSVPESVTKEGAANTAPAYERFEIFLKVLMDWAVDKYLPIFNDTYQLKTKYTTPTSVWKELDEILLGLIPSTWLPSYITDKTMDPTQDSTLGMNGNAQIPMQTTLDIICGWLVGSVLDLDLQQLLSLLQRNTSPNADFNNNLLKVIFNLLDRVFYVIFGKYSILPPNQGSRNPYGVSTNLTGLSGGSSPLLSNANLGNFLYYLILALSGKSESGFNANTLLAPILSTVLPLIVGLEYVKPFRDENKDSGGTISIGEISIGELENFIKDFNGLNSVVLDMVPVELDPSVVGDFYIVTFNGDTPTITPIHLDGTNYDSTVNYYQKQYTIDPTVDKYTKTDANHKYYKRADSYTSVTLDGSNFDPRAKYYETTFVEATVDETTNGTYFTAQNASSATILPENYVAGTTYYTHPTVNLAASSTGSYLTMSSTYTEVVLNGTSGNNFVNNKNYYVVKQTVIDKSYINTLNGASDRFAYGVYTSGDASTRGVGTYSSSIAGNDYFIYREQEDFKNALYTYNNFNNFIEDAEDFIGEYKEFINETVPAAAAKWKNFLANGGDAPDEIYPWYVANGGYNEAIINKLFITTADVNNLQVIKDLLGKYGTANFITSNTANATGQSLVPVASIVGGANKTVAAIYKGYKEWNEQLLEFSNNINNYFDGINYYLSLAEADRVRYDQVNPAQVEWMINFCTPAYHGGINVNPETNQPYYTSKSFEAFKNAYEAAVNLVSQVKLKSRDYPTTQSMCTYVREGLLNAYYALIEFGKAADLVQLNQYITVARRIRNAEQDVAGTDDATYENNSYNTLLSVLQEAIDCAASAPGIDEQTAVDRLASRLNAAINNLVYRLAPALENTDYEPEEGEEKVVIGPSWADGDITKAFIFGIPEIVGFIYDGAADRRIKVTGISQDALNYADTAHGAGTGTKIEGKNNAGLTILSYTAVIFGDINGDARIDGTDKNAIIAYANGVANSDLRDFQAKAADVNGDGSIDASDAAGIQQVIDYEAVINQAADVIGTRIVPVEA